MGTNEAYLFLIIEKMDYWRCFYGGSKASLSGSFMESFMTLNIINFADVAVREKDGVS